jgi:hypothetical protein
LGAVTGGEGRAGFLAAVGGVEAVAVSGIGFAEVPFGEAVEAEEEMCVFVGEIGGGGGDECGEVVGAIEVGGLDGEMDVGSDAGDGIADGFDCGFEAGHGVVGEEGDQVETLNVLVGEARDGVGDGRVLVSHGEFDWNVHACLESGLDAATDGDEG